VAADDAHSVLLALRATGMGLPEAMTEAFTLLAGQNGRVPTPSELAPLVTVAATEIAHARTFGKPGEAGLLLRDALARPLQALGRDAEWDPEPAPDLWFPVHTTLANAGINPLSLALALGAEASLGPADQPPLFSEAFTLSYTEKWLDNAIAMKLVEDALHSNLKDVRFPDTFPEADLQAWCDEALTNLITRKWVFFEGAFRGLRRFPGGMATGGLTLDGLMHLEEMDGPGSHATFKVGHCQRLAELPVALTVTDSVALGDLPALRAFPATIHWVTHPKHPPQFTLTSCPLVTAAPAIVGHCCLDYVVIRDCVRLTVPPAGITTIDRTLEIERCPAMVDLTPLGPILIGQEADFHGLEALEHLPEGMEISGDLNLAGCAAFRSLPSRLTVTCSIHLEDCAAWDGKIPTGAQEDSLYVSDTYPWGAQGKALRRIADLEAQVADLQAQLATNVVGGRDA
jgi:hypothetical protein